MRNLFVLLIFSFLVGCPGKKKSTPPTAYPGYNYANQCATTYVLQGSTCVDIRTSQIVDYTLCQCNWYQAGFSVPANYSNWDYVYTYGYGYPIYYPPSVSAGFGFGGYIGYLTIPPQTYFQYTPQIYVGGVYQGCQVGAGSCNCFSPWGGQFGYCVAP